MTQFLFRFDKPREHQDRMMNDIYKSIIERKSILVNAPTGIGKTDASISAAMTAATELGLDVFFLTPKTSQHKIALDVISGIKKKFNVNISYIDMVGKRNLCVNTKVNMIEGEAFYKSCEQLVKAKKCLFYNRSKEKGNIDLVRAAADEGHNKFFDASFEHGVCGYEAASDIAKDSKFIIADYAHILNPYTRAAFLKRIGHKVDNAIIIWDEAHNIMSSASSYLSTSLNTYGIANAAKELAAIKSEIDIEYLSFMLENIAEKKLGTAAAGESFFNKDDVAGMLTGNLENVSKDLQNAGLEYLASTQAKRSSLMHISRFLEALSEADESAATILTRHNKDVKLSLVCLYPEQSIDSLKNAYANVFMSGTMLPLEMHRDLLGMPDAKIAKYASPFPKHNRICMVDKEVSTKYQDRSQDGFKIIAERIQQIKACTRGNVAVFFPGFEVLNAVYRYMLMEVGFIQRRDMKSQSVEELISGFKKSDDSLLFAVMGGSLSEGIDYANNVIKGIIIVGIPLEKPNLELNSKIQYLDKKFAGKGSEYAYIVPGVVRAAQAAGRAIRGESDRAFVILMDKRYAWRSYANIIGNFVDISEHKDYLEEIKKFELASGEIQKAQTKS